MRETNQCAINKIFQKRFDKNEQKDIGKCLFKTSHNKCPPFKLIDDSGFRKILNSLLQSMRANFNINEDNIREKIGVKTNDVRYHIKLDVEHRLVSLKAGVETCRDRSILGVNLQFISDGKVQLRTLAMKELKKNHTSFYLKTVLDEVIEQYGIKSNQIYSITTDNGANMLKCVGLFSEEDVTERTGNAEKPSSSSWHSDAEELSSDEDDSGILNCINVEVFLGNLSSSHTSTPQAGNMWKSVRCAANTLQLVVEDALKKSSSRDVIDSARCICKKLRNLSVFVLLKNLKLRKPVLDSQSH